jgi:SAM-dependent methyltransferase
LSVDRFYREEAEDGAFTSPPFLQEVLEDLLSHIPMSTVRKALDMGSGSGANLEVLHRCFPAVVGADVSIRVLRTSKHVHNTTEFVTADIQNLPFKSGAFDVVVSTEVFEHVADLERAVLESRRILSEGGYLVVSTPNYGNLIGVVKWLKDWRNGSRTWEPWGAHSGGLERFMTARGLERELRKGFKILEKRGVDYFQSWLFLLKPLRRYYGRFLLVRKGRTRVLRSIGMHHFVIAEKR